MSTSQDRIPLTIQFTPGKDDDLIALIEAMPRGKRNGRIKALLRAGAEKERQGDQLTNIEKAVESLARQLANGVHINGNGQIADPSLLSSEQLDRRASRMDKAEW